MESALEECESEGKSFCIVDKTTFCHLGTDTINNVDLTALEELYIYKTSGENFPVAPGADGATTYQVSCEASDKYNNSRSTSFIFKVEDERSAPTFEYCPEDYILMLPNDTTTFTVKASFTPPTLTDSACNVNVTEFRGYSNETELILGIHQVPLSLYPNLP